MTDWGSVADWVSGVGSIGASIVALYLSGAEKRAKRAADRPTLSCRVTWYHADEAWQRIFLEMHNSSTKKWKAVSIEIVGPRGVKIVRQADTIRTDAGGSIAPSADIRHENGSRSVLLGMEVDALGTPEPSWRSGRANYSWEQLQVFLPAGLATLRMKVTIESSDPVPDRFDATIVRHRPATVSDDA